MSIYDPNYMLQAEGNHHICSCCGKEFVEGIWCDYWQYQTKYCSKHYWFCSYGCQMKFQKEIDEQKKAKKENAIHVGKARAYHLEWKGRIYTLKQLTEIHAEMYGERGLTYGTMKKRFEAGWSIERIMSTPMIYKGQRKKNKDENDEDFE